MYELPAYEKFRFWHWRKSLKSHGSATMGVTDADYDSDESIETKIIFHEGNSESDEEDIQSQIFPQIIVF
jgi:hypothetical protein